MCKKSLFINAYFADEHRLSAESIVRLWSKLDVFGRRSGVLYSPSTVSDSASDEVRLELGEEGALADLLGKEGGSMEGAIVVDDDISFGSHTLHPWKNGSRIARSILSLSEAAVRSVGWKMTLELISEYISLAASSKAFYGKVDYSKDSETISGGTFGSVIHLDAPLDSIVEQSIWLQQGVRQKRVRGVYWGNYLSRELLDKLGGNFAQEYRTQAQNLNGESTGLVWEFTQGTFVSISLDPTVGSIFGEDMMDIETLENVNWLVQRFTEARLL